MRMFRKWFWLNDNAIVQRMKRYERKLNVCLLLVSYLVVLFNVHIGEAAHSVVLLVLVEPKKPGFARQNGDLNLSHLRVPSTPTAYCSGRNLNMSEVQICGFETKTTALYVTLLIVCQCGAGSHLSRAQAQDQYTPIVLVVSAVGSIDLL